MLYCLVNESGATAAIYQDDLVRGEFHFVPSSTIAQIQEWKGLKVTAESISRMVLVDRRGDLTRL